MSILLKLYIRTLIHYFKRHIKKWLICKSELYPSKMHKWVESWPKIKKEDKFEWFIQNINNKLLIYFVFRYTNQDKFKYQSFLQFCKNPSFCKGFVSTQKPMFLVGSNPSKTRGIKKYPLFLDGFDPAKNMGFCVDTKPLQKHGSEANIPGHLQRCSWKAIKPDFCQNDSTNCFKWRQVCWKSQETTVEVY